jgi:hypothetical protein
MQWISDSWTLVGCGLEWESNEGDVAGAAPASPAAAHGSAAPNAAAGATASPPAATGGGPNPNRSPSLVTGHTRRIRFQVRQVGRK